MRAVVQDTGGALTGAMLDEIKSDAIASPNHAANVDAAPPKFIQRSLPDFVTWKFRNERSRFAEL
jgi:hypothetical protein